MSLDQDAQYRQVAVYGRLDEAEVARGLLEADGIPAALLDAQMAALGLGPAVGGVRLLVPAWGEDRALALLAPPPPGAFDEPLATPTPLAGTLQAVTPPRLLQAVEPAPAPAEEGPLAVRVALWVALALGLLVLAALRR